MTSMAGLEMHDAASTGDYDSLEQYIRSGKFDVNVGDVDWGYKTPLHWACQKGYVECARLLLDSGARGTVRTVTGWTPAHFAAENGKVTALRALHAANVPIDRKDIYGCTPKRIAEVYDHQDCVRFLQQAELELKDRREKMETEDCSDEDEIPSELFSEEIAKWEKENLKLLANEKLEKMEKMKKKAKGKEKLTEKAKENVKRNKRKNSDIRSK